jgi:hypothetical protein
MPQPAYTSRPKGTLSHPGGHSVARDQSLGYPMSRAQWRLWYQQAVQPEDSALNLRLATRLRTTVTVKRAMSAIEAVVDRHEVLRTVIVAAPGHAAMQQRVLADPSSPFSTIRCPNRTISLDQLAESATRWAAVPFDLGRETPFRAAVLLGPDERVLGLQFAAHHICWDAFSTNLLWRELTAELAGGATPGQRRPAQYAEFAVLESSQEFQQLRATAVRQAVARLADRPPPAEADPGAEQPADPDVIRFQLAAGTLDRAGELGRPSVFAVLVAAVARSLCRVLGRESVLLALDVSLRGELGRFDETIGLFQNQVIGQVADGPDEELLDRAELCVLQALEDRWAPYDEVIRELGWSGMLDAEPFDAKVWFDRCEPSVGGYLDPVFRWAETPRHDLTVGFTVYPDGTLGCSMSARPRRHRVNLAALYQQLQASLRILLEPAHTMTVRPPDRESVASVAARGDTT